MSYRPGSQNNVTYKIKLQDVWVLTKRPTQETTRPNLWLGHIEVAIKHFWKSERVPSYSSCVAARSPRPTNTWGSSSLCDRKTLNPRPAMLDLKTLIRLYVSFEVEKIVSHLFTECDWPYYCGTVLPICLRAFYCFAVRRNGVNEEAKFAFVFYLRSVLLRYHGKHWFLLSDRAKSCA